jgi:hypothetical protein
MKKSFDHNPPNKNPSVRVLKVPKGVMFSLLYQVGKL